MRPVEPGTPTDLPPDEVLLEAGGSALGRDPFAELAEPDPFLERLEALE